MTLAHSDTALRTFRPRTEAGKPCGARIETIDRARIRALVPSLNMTRERYPTQAGLWHRGTGRHDSAAWGYAARTAEMGATAASH